MLLGGGYFAYKNFKKNQNTTSYETTGVVMGTFIASVSGSGQVSAQNQIDLKPKVSGELVSLAISNGQELKTGAAIAQIDAGDALKTVRDAQANLETALLSLEKLKQPTDSLSLLQAQNALISAQNSKAKAEDDLEKAYQDGFNTVANAFLNLPGILSGFRDIFYTNTLNGNQANLYYFADAVREVDRDVDIYRDSVDTSYQLARKNYDENFLAYKGASRDSEPEVIEALINQTYDTVRLLSAAVKNSNNYLDFYEDRLAELSRKAPSLVSTYQTNLEIYTGQTNSHLSNLLSAQNNLKNDQDAIESALRSLQEKTESLAKLEVGPDALDLRSQELTITQRQNALSDAKEKLALYTVRAPFDGIVTEINVKRGDSVSSGTALATLLSKQRLAEISLNEVDVAKVKIGQKATLTFDALENFELTGQVIDIDSIGTVSSGVVSYNVKIGFDAQDERIKPGMSVSAVIITEVKPDVLLVPNSAVKTQGSQAYVEILENGKPQSQSVELGEANDTLTEVSGNIQAGKEVITQTITNNANEQSSQQQSSATGGGIIPIGGSSFSGGAFRGRD